MERTNVIRNVLRAGPGAALALGLALASGGAWATAPCGDFGECKVLIEINASDGDVGFHFLMDGDDLTAGRLRDPNGQPVFKDLAKGPLKRQKMTETFVESAEPLCWPDPEADPDDRIVTLEEFLGRWQDGTYVFVGRGDGEHLRGTTELTYELPAAPVDVDFDAGVVSWDVGDDLGHCADAAQLDALVMEGVLPVHPEDVTVDAWEIVLEPDVEDGDPVGSLVFRVRVPGDISPLAVTVPADYLAALPVNTPVKIEVGAIGGQDNGTFSEEDGFCVNEAGAGCEDE